MKIKDIDSTAFLKEFEKELNGTFINGNLVDEGMCYAILDGGKRIRPLCIYFGALAVGGDVDIDIIKRLAIAIECIHNYSLVHDDLPAMDNDDYRRGKLSVHKQFGYANAILIGDQLLSKAMFELSKGGVLYGERFSQSAMELSKVAMDMVYGQQLDLAGCNSDDEYLQMYAKKTGALIVGSMRAGARACCVGEDMVDCVGEYAKHLGLAFQLADDLLDVGEDNSIISVVGQDKARDMLKAETSLANKCACQLHCSEQLIAFAERLFAREV